MPARCRAVVPAAITGLVLVVTGGCSQPEKSPDAVGPADAYLELIIGTSEEAFARQATLTEELVAACMTEQGFEYLPNMSAYLLTDASAMENPPGSREYAERYGYGQASDPLSDPESGLEPDGPADPNAPLLAALSEAEQAARATALYGEADLDRDPEAPFDWEQAGCHGQAQHEVLGGLSDPAYVTLREEIVRIDTDVAPADPRVAAVDAAWSECMADAGYPGFTRQPDALAWWLEHFTESGGGAGEVQPDGWVEGVRELAREEALLATADWDCRGQTGYDDIAAQVRDKLQQEYVDAHRDELDAWVEKWAEG